MILIFILVLIILVYFYEYPCKKLHSVVRKNRNKNFPKIIFRTHREMVVSSSMYEYCHKKWIDLNPDYSMVWYTNKDCDRFMLKMGDRINKAYLKLKPGAFKADLWRACILYKYGGIYVDSYATPEVGLEEMLENCYTEEKDIFISVKDDDHIDIRGIRISGIHNGFIIATRKHPFLRQYIEDIVSNIESNYYGSHFLDVTGPFCLSRSINKVNGNHPDYISKIGKNIGKYNYYLFGFKSYLYQNINKGNKIIMKKKYSLISVFVEKILKRGNVYSYMWQNKNIYR
jgi:mannosyltransferase OCH1-like enzyme